MTRACIQTTQGKQPLPASLSGSFAHLQDENFCERITPSDKNSSSEPVQNSSEIKTGSLNTGSKNLPLIAAKNPFKIEVEAGKKYFWCSCGASKNQPFCDGSHKAYKKEDGTSIMKSVMFEATENKIIYFCGCKHSKNGVFCDGSHNKL